MSVLLCLGIQVLKYLQSDLTLQLHELKLGELSKTAIARQLHELKLGELSKTAIARLSLKFLCNKKLNS